MRERSASPEYVGGVSTQQNSSSAPDITSAISVVKWSRSRFRSSRSARPGSKIGTSPRRRDSTFSRTMSRQCTSCPSSAKHAAVTSPTQPAPITPIGSRSGTLGAYLSQGLRRTRDPEELALRQRLRERVRDPVDRGVGLPGDEAGPGAVAVQHVLPAADLHGGRGAAEDRGVGPGEALEAEVLADPAGGYDDPVRVELTAGARGLAGVGTRR